MRPLLLCLSLVSPAAASVAPLPQDAPAQDATAQTGEAHPALFRDLDWPGAKAAAKAEGKLLLLDAMTSWCGPCKVMDRTTWIDPRVADWVNEHAVAVQLDMDVHTAAKTEVGIRAYPTMVLYQPDGAEADRVVGLRDADAMLAWLEGVRGGKREVERVLEQLAALEAGGAPSLARRIALTGQAASLGASAEAGRQVLWLWRHQPTSDGDAQLLTRWRRGSGRNLAAELGPGDGELTMGLVGERNAREGQLKQNEDPAVREEWFALNHALSDVDRTLGWATRMAASPASRSTLQRHEQQLFDLLVDRGRWAAAGHALGDPLRSLTFLGDNLGAYDVAPSEAPAESTDAADRPRAIPAIPLGGMQPARPIPAPGEESEPDEDETVPEEEAPEEEAAEQDPKGTPRRAAIPAIPMGGMKPARPAIPMVAMGAPAPAQRPETPEEIARDVRARLTHQLRRNAARRYGSLLAAGRLAEAEAVASCVLGYADDDATRSALVACALRAGRLDARREAHLEWLDSVARGAGS